MTADAPGVRTGLSRRAWLVFGSILVWLLANAGTADIWLANGGAALALGIAVLLLERRASTALLKPNATLVLLGAAIGGLMAAATYELYPLVSGLWPFVAPDMARLYAAFGEPPTVVAAAVLVPVIVGEELVWRGVVQELFVGRLRVVGGVTLAALVYALVQAPLGSPSLVVAAFLCGLVWGALREATGSLVATLVAHLLWDFWVLLWMPLEVR
jgi:membrane protease YdiL (CAAX protease family)